MDLSQLSTEDLQAMRAGDLSKVSTSGLQYLKAQQAPAQPTRLQPQSDQEQAYAQGLAPDQQDAVLKQLRASQSVDAGALRAMAGIGHTLLTPVKWLAGKAGQNPVSAYIDRIGGGLDQLDAQHKGDLPYQASKLLTGVAATLPVGGALGQVAKGVGLARLGGAIESGGMATGAPKAAGDLLVRMAGGAINGGATAGLLNPADAKSGAVIGGVLPAAVQGAGYLGSKLGSLLRGPVQSPDTVAAIEQARNSGYVIPPSQANPTLANRTLEGFAGKLTTAQNASAKNQIITNAKAATDLGLPADTKITPEVLDAVRQDAGKAYQAVASLGKFDATGATLPASVRVEKSISPLLAGKTEKVDASELVRAWKQANADAIAYYRAYARDANPETLAKAKAAAGDAKQVDDFLQGVIQKVQSGKPADLIAQLASGKISKDEFVQKTIGLSAAKDIGQELKAARTQIAKTYTVESALNPATGTVDAKKLAKLLEKGKPLSGGLKEAASFAARFPKAAQAVEGMGSLPQTSPLDWIGGASLSAVSHNPLALAAVAARPAARAAALSPLVQNHLIQQQNAFRLMSPETTQLLYRTAPALVAGQ